MFLDYVNHAKILEALNATARNEQTDVMRILLDNKKFAEQEKIEALSDAVIDCNVPRVKLLVCYMTDITGAGIRSLLEIIKESKLLLGEKLKIDSLNLKWTLEILITANTSQNA